VQQRRLGRNVPVGPSALIAFGFKLFVDLAATAPAPAETTPWLIRWGFDLMQTLAGNPQRVGQRTAKAT
jgi:hypothetical protein